MAIDSAAKRDVIVNDTLPAADTSLSQPPSIRTPEGLYRAVLPGGQEHTLAFYPGKRYRLEERKGYKPPTRSAGDWAISNGKISLYRGAVVVAQCHWKGDTLVYLSGGREYNLQRLPSATDNNVWRNKKQEGLEFFGVGNEPFWNIAIDEQKAIAFHLAEWPRPQSFPPARPQAAGDSIQYSTANDSATLRVVIYQRFCNDGMSDYTYDQQVKVVYNNRVYQGCGLLFK